MPINKIETIARIARMLVTKAEDELMDLVEDVMEAEAARGVKPTSARMDQIETDLVREVLKAMTSQTDEAEAKHQTAPREPGF